MKINFKTGIAGMLMAASLVPAFAFAEDGINVSATATTSYGTTMPTGNKYGNFCASITSVGQKLIENIDKTDAKQLDRWNENSTKTANREGEIDAKRAANRIDADNRNASKWEKMYYKVKTDSQKAAVATYKATIQTAITTRRGAVDAAVKAYRDNLTTAMTTRSGAIKQALVVFRASVNTAIVKAQADCAANVASQTVRENFNKAVNDARDILNEVRDTEQLSNDILDLKDVRDDAIRAAERAFRKTANTARITLRAELKK